MEIFLRTDFILRYADGQLRVFQIGSSVGYGIPFGEKGWFRTAGGFGFASRRDVINIYCNLINLI